MTMCTLNLNFKISGKIMGSQGGLIIFDHMQTKAELLKFLGVGLIIFDHVQTKSQL